MLRIMSKDPPNQTDDLLREVRQIQEAQLFADRASDQINEQLLNVIKQVERLGRRLTLLEDRLTTLAEGESEDEQASPPDSL